MQVLVTITLVAQKQPQAMRKPFGMAYSNATLNTKTGGRLDLVPEPSHFDNLCPRYLFIYF